MNFQQLLNEIYNGNKINFSKCENLNLALNKLIKREIIERGGREKSKFLETFKRIPKLVRNPSNFYNDVKGLLGKQGYIPIIEKPFTTKSRLIVGLGSSHVLETALTLHHTYGIPYIPGSALKGVCRAVAFWKLAEKKGILNNEKEIKELSEKFYGKLVENDDDILTYQLLFGTQDFRGLLLFLDAYPIINENTEIFELDIMNVHYPSYYGDSSGKTVPGDWENPIPIYFLTVKSGIKFNICVLFDEFRWNKLKELEKFKNKNDVINEVEKLINGNFLEEILKIAISQFGVGAKGRLGYGILE